jgi:hypothetical protein
LAHSVAAIEVVVFEEDQIGARGFISDAHVKSRRFQGVLAVDRKKYGRWMIFGLQQCSRQVVLVALVDFVLGGALELSVLVSRVKTQVSPLVVIPGNDGCPVISLLKALFEDWTFMVKTRDLTILVSPNNDGVCALLPSWRRHFGEAFSES